MIKLFAPLFILFALLSPVAHSSCHSLEDIFATSELSSLTQEQIKAAKNTAQWSSDKALVTFCFDQTCYIAKTCGDEIKLIDVSHGINLGYFGVNLEYERLEARPLRTSWEESDVYLPMFGCKSQSHNMHATTEDDPEKYATLIQTRVWIDGQRYTACEPILVYKDDALQR